MRGKGLEARLVSHEDKAFRGLLKEMEGECARRFGKNGKEICRPADGEVISTCVILKNGQGIACGILQPLDEQTAQVRCLYVKQEFRGQGLGTDVIQTLELQGLWQGFFQIALSHTRDMKECAALGKKLSFRKSPGDNGWIWLKKDIE